MGIAVRATLLASALVAVVATHAQAQTQDYPNRPIRAVIGFGSRSRPISPDGCAACSPIR